MNSTSYEDVTQSDELSLSPVGTILAWSPKVDPSSGDLVPLPNGWQLCDGSPITQGINLLIVRIQYIKKTFFSNLIFFHSNPINTSIYSPYNQSHTLLPHTPSLVTSLTMREDKNTKKNVLNMSFDDIEMKNYNIVHHKC